MATYDLNATGLRNYLSSHVSDAVKYEVIAAMKAAGTFPPNDQSYTEIDEIFTKGALNEAASVKLVVDDATGTLSVHAKGPVVIGMGEQNGNLQITSSYGDTVFAGGGTDIIDAEKGNNAIHAGTGADTIYGGTGKDTIYGGAGHDKLVAGGKSLIYAGSGANTLYGGATSHAHDTLYGGAGADLLRVTQGNNYVRGGTGLNTIHGGSGHDTLVGGGQSLVYAGSGASSLYGGLSASAHDTLYGGSGNDFLSVKEGTNVLHAGTGLEQTLKGGTGSDSFTVSSVKNAHDVVNGGGGDDTLTLSGRTFEDAKITQHANGSTTIYFASNNQTVTVSNVETIKFSDHTLHPIK